MKNLILGVLIGYLAIYSVGSTYLLYKGGFVRVWGCRNVFSSICELVTFSNSFYSYYEFN